jgi:hypothetical protein
MGAWGTALFSDDTACDVRDSCIDLVGDGLTGPEATKALLREWSASLNDPDESPVFWLALAATQWRCGRLEDHVLQQALNVIDSGSDLATFRRKNPLSDIGRVTLHAMDMVFGGDFARVHSRARGEWTVPA